VADEPASLRHGDVTLDLVPRSPTEYAVSFDEGLVHRRIQRANLLTALRSLV
jgi:hypothetical protein